MRDFSFNPEIAAMYGVDEAIFLHHLFFWIEHNEANGRHYYEDAENPGVWRHWTYNSAEALSQLFPFWTKNKIDKLTRKMATNLLIHVGNYNKSKFDRTKWYAINNEILSYYRQCRYSQAAECQTAERQNENQPNGNISNSQTAAPIPDNIPVKNTVSKPDKKQLSDFWESAWNLYPNKKGKAQVSESQKTKLYAVGLDALSLCIERYKKDKPDWQQYQNGSTFFNSGYVDYLDGNYTPGGDTNVPNSNRGNGGGVHPSQSDRPVSTGEDRPRFGHVAGTGFSGEMPPDE